MEGQNSFIVQARDSARMWGDSLDRLQAAETESWAAIHAKQADFHKDNAATLAVLSIAESLDRLVRFLDYPVVRGSAGNAVTD